jgi:glycosyltransferase involved in cell wall biosynthesis
MNLKVLVVTQYFPPIINGPSLYIYNLVEELVKKGICISVYTIEFPEETQKQLNITGYEVRRFKYVFDPRRSLHDQPISFSYIMQTVKRSDHFDVIHVHDFPKISNDILILTLKKLKPGVPVILTPHGAGSLAPAHKFSSKLYWSIGIPWKVLRSVDHLIAVSPLQGKLLAKICGCNKVSTILGAIPPYYFVEEPHFIENGKLKILFIGRIAQEKGVKALLYAVREAKKVLGRNIELRCIGPDYGYLREALRIMNELKLNDVVKILGPLPEEEKIRNLDWCDVLVLPSYYEAFGLPLLEAMARGKPVIATKTVGGISLVRHGETGFLVEIGDWSGIARMLLHFSNNLELKYQMGQKALRYARQFSMQGMIEQHIKLYQKLVCSRKY